jgi:hypothetical protein
MTGGARLRGCFEVSQIHQKIYVVIEVYFAFAKVANGSYLIAKRIGTSVAIGSGLRKYKTVVKSGMT